MSKVSIDPTSAKKFYLKSKIQKLVIYKYLSNSKCYSKSSLNKVCRLCNYLQKRSKYVFFPTTFEVEYLAHFFYMISRVGIIHDLFV